MLLHNVIMGYYLCVCVCVCVLVCGAGTSNNVRGIEPNKYYIKIFYYWLRRGWATIIFWNKIYGKIHDWMP
jgi:hypothetical protein